MYSNQFHCRSEQTECGLSAVAALKGCDEDKEILLEGSGWESAQIQ